MQRCRTWYGTEGRSVGDKAVIRRTSTVRDIPMWSLRRRHTDNAGRINHPHIKASRTSFSLPWDNGGRLTTIMLY